MVLRFAAGRAIGAQPTFVSAALSSSARPRVRREAPAAPNRSNTERAASFPTAASQLIELSKREAVGDRSIAGPKKDSSGTRPAFQPALVGTKRSRAARER